MRKTTWFRVVVTPLSFDPVEIYVGANTRIGDVPIRTTPLGVRLTNQLFRVGLEALAPHAVANGSRVSASISHELTDLIGIDPVYTEKDLGPLHATGKLRTLKITSVSGAKLHELALKNYKARVAKIHITSPQGQQLSEDQKLARFYGDQLTRLAEVQNDFVCIRIEAGFSKTAVSIWGFDLAKLNGEIGEMFLAFDQRLNRLRCFCFFDVDLSAVVSIVRDIVDLFADVPKSVNDAIEQAIEAGQEHLLKYFRAFLARAVGPSNVVYDIRFRNDAWQIRNSADPVIPKPGQTLPHFEGGLREDGTVLELLSLGHELGNIVPAPLEPAPPPAVPEPSPDTPAPSSPSDPPPASMAHELPTGFLTAGEQLDRLDRHQSIVVVMMENRSYDHMLGDLMHLRPDPEDPYDGAPFGVKNAAAGGFQSGVPLVRARDLLLGTAIPVSPRHSFKATRLQIGDGTETEAGLDTGDMAGFARDLNRRSDSPQIATTVYSERDLGVHYKLADEFCTCERWFAAHPGPTYPNRFATIMGRIPELENFENDDPRIGYLKDRNIFDALTGARIDWRVFESDLSLIRMFDRYRLNSTNVVPFEDPGRRARGDAAHARPAATSDVHRAGFCGHPAAQDRERRPCARRPQERTRLPVAGLQSALGHRPLRRNSPGDHLRRAWRFLRPRAASRHAEGRATDICQAASGWAHPPGCARAHVRGVAVRKRRSQEPHHLRPHVDPEDDPRAQPRQVLDGRDAELRRPCQRSGRPERRARSADTAAQARAVHPPPTAGHLPDLRLTRRSVDAARPHRRADAVDDHIHAAVRHHAA